MSGPDTVLTDMEEGSEGMVKYATMVFNFIKKDVFQDRKQVSGGRSGYADSGTDRHLRHPIVKVSKGRSGPFQSHSGGKRRLQVHGRTTGLRHRPSCG